MDLQLAGRTALVTAGSRGLGFAIARELCVEGTRVALLARNRDAVEVAASKLHAEGYDAVGISADTTVDMSVQLAVAQITERFGRIDILVNCASQTAAGPATGLADLNDDELRAEIETKVVGYLRCARAVAPDMIDRDWGRIINISGLKARRTGSVFGSIRNVSVAAVSKNLADELGPRGINVTVVHPGVTETEPVRDLIRNGAAAQGVTEAEFREGAGRRCKHWPRRPAIRGRACRDFFGLAAECGNQR